MAESPAKALIAFAAIAVMVELAAATNYTVGAPGGSWDLRTNYSTWASPITFKTGDNLIFSYSPSNHDVLEVSKANYDTCTITGPIKTYTSGNDVIPLSSPGKRYFICGFPGHCGFGMKLQVDTIAAPSSGSPSPTPSPSRSPAPTPSPSASTPPTPSPSGSPPPTPNQPGSPPPTPSPSTIPPASGSPPPASSVPSTPTAPFSPEGSPPPASTTPAGSTPSGAPVSKLSMANMVATAGLVGVGMLTVFAL